jgi:hypothetical protein
LLRSPQKRTSTQATSTSLQSHPNKSSGRIHLAGAFVYPARIFFARNYPANSQKFVN